MTAPGRSQPGFLSTRHESRQNTEEKDVLPLMMKLWARSVLCVFSIGRALAWTPTAGAGLWEAQRSEGHALVAFVLPNHRDSEVLEPEWAAVKEAETDTNIINVDCASEPKVCAAHGISSFPAIRLYRENGTRVERYRGPRKASSIGSFLRRSQRPALSTITEKNLTSFLGVDDIVFVAHLLQKDAVLRDRFESTAKKYRDRFSFAVAMTQAQSMVVCNNNIDGVQKAITGLNHLAQVDAIEKFVKQCSTPLIPELTRRNEMEYSTPSKSLVHYFVSSTQERDEYAREMLPLAKKYEEYLQFTTIDTREYAEMLPVYGQEPGSTRVLSVYHPSNGQVFVHGRMEKASAVVVEEFLLDIIGGKVKPWLGHQPAESGAGHDEL